MSQLNQKTFSGQLTRSPFAGQAAPAMAYPFPLHTENDFEVASRFPGVPGTPVLVSYFEHFMFLSALVERTLDAYGEVDTILIKMAMPCGARLTPVLLQDRVLLCQDVAPERDKRMKEGRPLVVVQDSIIRNPQELGTNTIRIDVIPGASTEQNNLDAAHTGIMELMTEFGVSQSDAAA